MYILDFRRVTQKRQVYNIYPKINIYYIGLTQKLIVKITRNFHRIFVSVRCACVINNNNNNNIYLKFILSVYD